MQWSPTTTRCWKKTTQHPTGIRRRTGTSHGTSIVGYADAVQRPVRPRHRRCHETTGVTAGTVLVTAATNPELVAEIAVAIVNGPPTIIVQNGDPTGEYSTVSYDKKRVRSSGWGGYTVFGGLIGIVGLILLYEAGGRWRSVAKIIAALLVGAMLFWFGIIGADVFCCLVVVLGLIALWKFGGQMRTIPKVITIVLWSASCCSAPASSVPTFSAWTRLRRVPFGRWAGRSGGIACSIC